MSLESSYRAAVYVVHAPGGSIELHLEEGNADLAPLVGDLPWAFVTAWNPGSVPRELAANRAAQQELARALAGHRTLPGEGRSRDGTWREESLLVIGIEIEEALALARRFGQVAIVAGDGGRPARLVFT